MVVVEHVLQSMSDTEQLSIQMAESRAVRELVQEYNTLVLALDRPESGSNRLLADGDMCGADFKLYIAFLTAYEQMRLLNRYLSHLPLPIVLPVIMNPVPVPPALPPPPPALPPPRVEHDDDEDDEPPTPETDALEERESKRFKRNVFRGMVYTCLALVLVMVGAMVAIMVVNHTTPDNAIIKTLMETSVDLIKILIGATSSK